MAIKPSSSVMLVFASRIMPASINYQVFRVSRLDHLQAKATSKRTGCTNGAFCFAIASFKA